MYSLYTWIVTCTKTCHRCLPSFCLFYLVLLFCCFVIIIIIIFSFSVKNDKVKMTNTCHHHYTFGTGIACIWIACTGVAWITTPVTCTGCCIPCVCICICGCCCCCCAGISFFLLQNPIQVITRVVNAKQIVTKRKRDVVVMPSPTMQNASFWCISAACEKKKKWKEMKEEEKEKRKRVPWKKKEK